MGHSPFALAWLGALGASTSRIAMGTSVLTPTFRYHPSIVAQAFATLGVMFPGRVILGVGTGESLNEVPATGMAWPEAKERFARLREAVALIRRLWTEERVTFEGEYYRTQNATIYDRPDAMVPLYIAGAGPLITKYAGRVAEGFICTSGKATDLYTATLLPNLAAGEAAAQRTPGSVDRMIEMKVSFDIDLARARADTRHWAALSLTPEEKLSIEDSLEMERLAAALPENAQSAGGSCRATLTSTWPCCAAISTWDSGIWCSTRPGPIRNASCGFTRNRCCLSCARFSRLRLRPSRTPWRASWSAAPTHPP